MELVEFIFNYLFFRDELHGVRLNGQKTKPSTFDKESILGKTVVR